MVTLNGEYCLGPGWVLYEMLGCWGLEISIDFPRCQTLEMFQTPWGICWQERNYHIFYQLCGAFSKANGPHLSSFHFIFLGIAWKSLCSLTPWEGFFNCWSILYADVEMPVINREGSRSLWTVCHFTQWLPGSGCQRSSVATCSRLWVQQGASSSSCSFVVPNPRSIPLGARNGPARFAPNHWIFDRMIREDARRDVYITSYPKAATGF